MITGRQKEKLTIDLLLEKVSEYDIYKYYLGDFQIGRNIKSPFRRDSSPSFSVDITKKGRLRHKDWGDGRYTGSCIDLVMQLHNISFSEALLKIDTDMGIGITGEKKNDFCKVKMHTPEELLKRRKNILVLSQAYSEGSLFYWKMNYGITEQELFENHIYCVERLYIDGVNIPRDMYYSYAYHLGDYIKIYTPLQDKREYKWISNVPPKIISGLDKLTGNPKLIITKSKKDEIVLRKVHDNVISLQNESKDAVDEKILAELKEKYDIYLAFDNDDPGKLNSKIICDMYNLKPIFVDDKYIPIKDYADLIKYRGLEVLRKEINNQLC